MATENTRWERSGVGSLYRVVAVLLMLAAASSVLAVAPLAKYATAVDSEDSARVAAFAVTAAPDSTQTTNVVDLQDTTTASYKFTVTNRNATQVSEVATTYDIKVTLPTAMEGVSVTMQKNGAAVSGTLSADGTTYTFSGVGTFQANTATTDTLTLIFTKDSTLTTYANYENVKVEAVTTQLD